MPSHETDGFFRVYADDKGRVRMFHEGAWGEDFDLALDPDAADALAAELHARAADARGHDR